MSICNGAPRRESLRETALVDELEHPPPGLVLGQFAVVMVDLSSIGSWFN